MDKYLASCALLASLLAILTNWCLSQQTSYPAYNTIPSGLTFTCQGRQAGYYADPEAQCQVWHWCLPSGAKYSFLCPNGTVFNQAVRVCDWWFNVDCASSVDRYIINDDLYKDANANKSFLMAVGRYNKITEALAQMKQQILGPESAEQLTPPMSAVSAQIQNEEPQEKVEAFTTRISEKSSELYSTSGPYSEEKSSLRTSSSLESIEKTLNDKQVNQGESNSLESKQTSDSATKESDSTNEDKDNIFHDLFKKLKNKNINNYGSFSSSDSNGEDEDDDLSSTSSENDKTIQNIFLEEISKSNENDEDELNISKPIETEEIVTKMKQDSEDTSEVSSKSESRISFKNIFFDEPLNIEKILGDIKHSNHDKKSFTSKNCSEENISEIYDNEDKASVRTRFSQMKRRKSKKKNTERKKSQESQISSIKAKSVKVDGKMKIPLHNTTKPKKDLKVMISKINKINETHRNDVKKDFKYKINERNLPLKKLHTQIPPNKDNAVKIPKIKVTAEKKRIENKVKNSVESRYSKHFSKIQKIPATNTKQVGSNKLQLNNQQIDKKLDVSRKGQMPPSNKGDSVLIDSGAPVSLPNFKNLSNQLPLITSNNDSLISGINKKTEPILKTAPINKNNKESDIALNNPQEILSKIEQQIKSKISEFKVDQPQLAMDKSLKETNKVIPKKHPIREPVKKKTLFTVSTEKKKSIVGKHVSAKHDTNRISKLKNNKSNNTFFTSNKSLKDNSEGDGELQKDGENKNKMLVKASFIKNISKSESGDGEKNLIPCKATFSNESMCELQNGVLTMNIDEKKSLHFPFILGRSASKSFNIQANIQQITSLVRMLPKESIQRTLMEDTETATRNSAKLTERGEFKCPACNEKTSLFEGSDLNVFEDPWDNTSKNFVRCTCMSKNTVSSKKVLRQLLLQNVQSQFFPPSCDTSCIILEDSTNRKSLSEMPSIANFSKRNDLTKLLHATQRFVTHS